MKQLCKVVMLATKERSLLAICFGKLYFEPKSSGYVVTENNAPQHLYLVSNLPIKEGDWVVQHGLCKIEDEFWRKGQVVQKLGEKVGYDFKITKDNGNIFYVPKGQFHKIESTTDSSLNLPLIPENFIQKYVKSNGKIKQVEIEMKAVFPKLEAAIGREGNIANIEDACRAAIEEKPKLKDGYVIISPKEEYVLTESLSTCCKAKIICNPANKYASKKLICLKCGKECQVTEEKMYTREELKKIAFECYTRRFLGNYLDFEEYFNKNY